MDTWFKLFVFATTFLIIKSQDTVNYAQVQGTTVDGLHRLVFEQQARIGILEEKIELLQTSEGRHDVVVAFTAYTTVDRYYNTGEILIFDGIETNYGAHYNASSGIFTCPITGVYVVHSCLTSYNARSMTGHMMKEGHILATARGDHFRPDQGVALVVTSCEAGERIWNENVSTDAMLHGRTDVKYSTFSGFLLYKH